MRLHPAFVVLGALGVAAAGRSLWVLDPTLEPGWLLLAVRRLGTLVGGAGILTLVLAYGAMARAGTTIDPRRATTRIVTTGIYRLSRNPIYLGWFLVILGGGLHRLSLVPALTAPLMLALLRWAVVVHEEEYLESAFGEEYRRYKGSVRRWL